jgi:hypothetical protein
MVPLTTAHAESRESYSPRTEKRCQRHRTTRSNPRFAAHCSVTAKAQDKFTRHQNVERYRRLLKTSTDEERRNYLGRLIVEERQKQKDAGDSEYQY